MCQLQGIGFLSAAGRARIPDPGEILGVDYTRDIDYERRYYRVFSGMIMRTGQGVKENAAYRKAKIDDNTTFQFLLFICQNTRELLPNISGVLFVNIEGRRRESVQVDAVYRMLERMEKNGYPWHPICCGIFREYGRDAGCVLNDQWGVWT